MNEPSCQIYLISPLDVGGPFPDRLARALDAAAVAAFQLRIKDFDDHAAAKLAEPLQRICADRDVAFIVNDSIGLAKRLGADGVHLGQGDGDLADARAKLGRDAQIGVTCHDSRHLAMEAGEGGADYVAFGAFHATQSKAPEKLAMYGTPTKEILENWSAVTTVPSIAIGGITPANCVELVTAGADFIAAITAVWNHPHGAAVAVKEFNEAMKAGLKARG
jgi:thiamine-phosphate pyrophosphorylase